MTLKLVNHHDDDHHHHDGMVATTTTTSLAPDQAAPTRAFRSCYLKERRVRSSNGAFNDANGAFLKARERRVRSSKGASFEGAKGANGAFLRTTRTARS
jgi:hypothetical protein